MHLPLFLLQMQCVCIAGHCYVNIDLEFTYTHACDIDIFMMSLKSINPDRRQITVQS